MPSARRVSWAKFRVAATSFVALLILGVFFALLTGGRLFQHRDRLRSYLADAAGIGKATPVRLNGIPIGKIVSVRLLRHPTRQRVIEVVFEIDHRYLPQIPIDSVATITAENVQGELYLDITRGRSATSVGPNGEITFQAAPAVLKSIDLAQFENRLRAIDALIAAIQQGKGRVGQFVVGDRLYRETVARILELEQTLKRAAKSEESLGGLLYSDADYRKVMQSIQDLNDALMRAQRSPWMVDSGSYEQMRAAVAAIGRGVANTRKAPIIAGDRMYRDWNLALQSVVLSVDRFNTRPDMLNAQTYESLNGSVREFGDSLRDFRTNPKKYLRLKIF